MIESNSDDAITRIRGTRGLSIRVAEACGITRGAVSQWPHVPIARVHVVSDIIGLSPQQIRPDIFKPYKRNR